MFPKWFNDWNNSNPTDVFKPAILVGTVGGAVLAATLIVSLGQPLRVEALQTGPPGIGMAVIDREGRPADPTIAGYVSSAPVAPGTRTAGEADPATPAPLADLSPENAERLLAAMRAWTGIPDLLEDPDDYRSAVAARMIQMTQYINEEWSAHVNANQEVGVNCYTCHRGQPVPSEVWFRIDPVVGTMDGWGEVQNRATIQSQYTSLPSDALWRYLYNAERISVHDLDSRVPDRPEDEGVATWQNAERTFSLMNYFANSLGVNCVFCHNSRAFYDPEQVTPQWATASLGIIMVQEVNLEFLDSIQDVLPPERLGPVYGDVPKVACATCHKGWNQPLQGLNVIADWPELATSEAPDYSAIAN